MAERGNRFTHDAKGKRRPIADVRAELVRSANAEAAARLARTDWMVLRELDTNGLRPMPAAVKSYRQAVRGYADGLEAQAASVVFGEDDAEELLAMFAQIDKGWPTAP